MPIAELSAKGQVTIPKSVRKALDLRPPEKVIIVVDGDQVVIKPIRGNLLDIGASVKIPAREKPIDFSRVREQVRKKIGRRVAEGG